MIIDTKRVIVPNWFSKSDIENLNGEKMSVKKFNRFRIYLEICSIDDEISTLISNYLNEFKEIEREAKRGK